MKAAFSASCLLLGILAGGLLAPDALAAEAASADDAAAAEPATEGEKKAPEPVPAESKPAESKDERYGHALQFGLRAALTGGYRVIFRYDKSPFCRVPDPFKSDKDQQKFCGSGAPLALDLALSFGVLDFIEPYVWGRFGLKGEAATNTSALTAFGAGARIYTMSDSKLKIFVEPAVGVETEGGGSSPAWTFMNGTKPEYKTDFLFHLAVGPHYDFARQFGIYMNAGLTTGVLRYIHTELELSGGLQARVP